MNWKEYSKELPWICGLTTFNSESVIYACLQTSIEHFDVIIITDDGSQDETYKEVERFIRDYKTKKIIFYDVSSWDPLPNLALKRDHGGENMIKDHPLTKCHTKAKIKSLLTCKEYAKNKLTNAEFIYFSLEDDILLYDNIKERCQERISKWEDPDTDSEFFNVTQTINKEYVRIMHDPGLIRRKDYDNGGDWTFACFYGGGRLIFGPDPINPWGACLYPWIRKNQIGKKGNDRTSPFGLHLLYHKKKRDGFALEEGWKRVASVVDIKDFDVNTKIIDKLDLKLDIKIDENAILRVVEGEN